MSLYTLIRSNNLEMRCKSLDVIIYFSSHTICTTYVKKFNAIESKFHLHRS
jgi:hypothetical protein